MHIKTLLVSIVLLLPILSQAQEKPEIIKTELLTLCFNGFIPGYYYRNGKEVHKLTASSQGISTPVYYEGIKTIGLYENEADLAPVPEGETPPKPLLSVVVPKGSDRVLIMFAFDNKKNELPTVRSYGINDDNLKEGDYRIFNFTKKDVYVTLKDKKSSLVLPSGKQGNISSGSWGRKNQTIDVLLGSKKEGKTVLNYSSRWGHRPERRSFIFVFDSPDRNRPLDIRKFFDVPSFKPSKVKQPVSKEPTPP